MKLSKLIVITLSTVILSQSSYAFPDDPCALAMQYLRTTKVEVKSPADEKYNSVSVPKFHKAGLEMVNHKNDTRKKCLAKWKSATDVLVYDEKTDTFSLAPNVK